MRDIFPMAAERLLITIIELNNTKMAQQYIDCRSSNQSGLLPYTYSCCVSFLSRGHSGRATGSSISPARMHLNQTPNCGSQFLIPINEPYVDQHGVNWRSEIAR